MKLTPEARWLLGFLVGCLIPPFLGYLIVYFPLFFLKGVLIFGGICICVLAGLAVAGWFSSS